MVASTRPVFSTVVCYRLERRRQRRVQSTEAALSLLGLQTVGRSWEGRREGGDEAEEATPAQIRGLPRAPLGPSQPSHQTV